MKIFCASFFLLVAMSGFSCNAQPSSHFVWKDFEFQEAGVKASLPCVPDKSSKVFQEKPKLAKSYSVSCSTSDFSFAISLPERFDNFNPERADKELREAEDVLTRILEEKARLSGKEIIFQGLPAREFTVRNDWTTGRQIAIFHERGIYNLLVSFTAPEAAALTNQQRSDFETVANKFFDSVQLVK
ncbi:MAG: hypothetical protein ABL959_09835 [Pyrinomonadaceae bacterium]